MASDLGGSVTLIFYKIGDNIWKEPALNVLAAACQWSSFTHVELAIGNAAGVNGNISNVVRVFNDNVGVVNALRNSNKSDLSNASIRACAERAGASCGGWGGVRCGAVRWCYAGADAAHGAEPAGALARSPYLAAPPHCLVHLHTSLL